MKIVRSFVLILISLVVVSSCFEPPSFSDRPKIRIHDIEYVNSPDAALKLTLFFQDGDGNLGLRNDETDYPYQPQNVFADMGGELFNLYEENDLDTAMRITRKRSKTTRVPDLPKFEPPTDCRNYRYDSILLNPQAAFLVDATYNVTEYDFGNGKFLSVKDTLYVEANPNHHNIDVTIWVQCDCKDVINSSPCCMDRDNNGKADPEYEFQFGVGAWPECGEGFNGRFPYVARENESPTEGTIAYSIKSLGFESELGLSTRIRIKARIRDRALNESNEVISGAFSLSEVTK